MKSIVCVMLANGRPEMVWRAIQSYAAQDYPRKSLYIYDSGAEPTPIHVLPDRYPDFGICYHRALASPSRGIGVLRNEANGWTDADIIAHWDSDDWSHPRRLTEQMEMLERSRADVVGYRECLFWDSTKAQIEVDPSQPGPDGVGCLGIVRSVGEAWIYRAMHPGMVIGSSMLYPRETWEKRPFPDRHTGEDTCWLLNGRFKVHAVPSTFGWDGLPGHEPRMVCAIHGQNTSSKIVPGAIEWKRAPQFDAYCRDRMAIHATR